MGYVISWLFSDFLDCYCGECRDCCPWDFSELCQGYSEGEMQLGRCIAQDVLWPVVMMISSVLGLIQRLLVKLATDMLLGAIGGWALVLAQLALYLNSIRSFASSLYNGMRGIIIAWASFDFNDSPRSVCDNCVAECFYHSTIAPLVLIAGSMLLTLIGPPKWPKPSSFSGNWL